MPLFRSKAEDKVRAAGYDPARLPPGQYLTEKWPVLHAGDVPHVDLATWRLRVFGEVEEEITLDFEQLQALPATEITTDIHCVTRWSRFDARLPRRPLARARDALPAEAVGALRRSRTRRTASLRTSRSPRSRRRTRSIVYEADGEPLTAEHGGPVRLVVPSRYFWKSAKWLNGLELVAADKPGFWERSATTTTPIPGRKSDTASEAKGCPEACRYLGNPPPHP